MLRLLLGQGKTWFDANNVGSICRVAKRYSPPANFSVVKNTVASIIPTEAGV